MKDLELICTQINLFSTRLFIVFNFLVLKPAVGEGIAPCWKLGADFIPHREDHIGRSAFSPSILLEIKGASCPNTTSPSKSFGFPQNGFIERVWRFQCLRFQFRCYCAWVPVWSLDSDCVLGASQTGSELCKRCRVWVFVVNLYFYRRDGRDSDPARAIGALPRWSGTWSDLRGSFQAVDPNPNSHKLQRFQLESTLPRCRHLCLDPVCVQARSPGLKASAL